MSERIINEYDGTRLANAVDALAENLTGYSGTEVTPTDAMKAKLVSKATGERIADAIEDLAENVIPAHTIQDKNGTSYTQRRNLKFMNATIVDDSANDATIVAVQGGGGIALPDVSGATATSLKATVSLTWTDPNDVVVDGQTLATWAGTLVVKKAGSAPEDTDDGTVLIDSTTKNAYASTPLTDNNVEYGTTYYYRFFPYTTQDVYTDGSSVSATPSKVVLQSVPTQDGSLTYTSSSQEPSFNNYDSDALTKTGETSGTNAGTYYAKFTPKSDYVWGTNSKTLTITEYVDSVQTRQLTGLTGGSDCEGLSFDFSEVENGDHTGAITVSDGTDSVTNNFTFTIGSAVEIVPFATGTDAQIKAMLDAYYADEITWAEMGWNVGDTRTISLNSMAAPNPNSSGTWAAQDITVAIVAHDHHDLETPINGHTKACITTQVREVLNDNSSSANQAGHIYVNGDSSNDMTFTKWANLYMRTYLNSTVLGAIPSGDFKSAIKSIKHYCHTNYNTADDEQVTDILFLPSYPEIFGTESFTYYTPTTHTEGTQWPYYQTSSNRIKYGNNNGVSNGVAQNWWNGSASSYTSSNGYFLCGVLTSGSFDYFSGVYALGLAPAWCM